MCLFSVSPITILFFTVQSYSQFQIGNSSYFFLYQKIQKSESDRNDCKMKVFRSTIPIPSSEHSKTHKSYHQFQQIIIVLHMWIYFVVTLYSFFSNMLLQTNISPQRNKLFLPWLCFFYFTRAKWERKKKQEKMRRISLVILHVWKVFFIWIFGLGKLIEFTMFKCIKRKKQFCFFFIRKTLKHFISWFYYVEFWSMVDECVLFT